MSTSQQSRRYGAKKEAEKQLSASEPGVYPDWKIPLTPIEHTHAKGAIDLNWPGVPNAHARLPGAQKRENVKELGVSQSKVRLDLQMDSVIQHNHHSGNLSSRNQSRPSVRDEIHNKSWKYRLRTFEQYQYESNLEVLALQGSRLVDDPLHSHDWKLWLELIHFRIRHHGAAGAMAIYKEILQRSLRLPTQGMVANQLWDLLIRLGLYDDSFREVMATYALRLKCSTTESWPWIYYRIVSLALKYDPASAYSWHLKLKNDFPPSLADYKQIFKLSLDWGCSSLFRRLYKETPLTGMYRTVIRHLCKTKMYDEALEWHDLLCDARDFPTRLTDIKPLLDHLADVGDGSRLESITRALTEADIVVSKAAESFVRRNAVVSREILNRRLGTIHGVEPKQFSDSFCARLFATQLFSVDTIVSGLQLMAVETIGPLSLREIAARADCDPSTICRHVDNLKTAGINIDTCEFCTLVRTWAVENKSEILKSIVECDLHPDTFGDLGLQEQLLAQYYTEHDLTKIERTLAVFTTGRGEVQMLRMNLMLRCLVTLGRSEKVLVMLEQMKYMDIPVSARSSMHLRVCWLSRRQDGRGADTIQELSVLIQAMQMTMESGRHVPATAWREFLRRLGMAGRLTEVENLALWLVDRYPSVADKKAIFTTAAKHAIVAWGFQHFMKSSRIFIRLHDGSMMARNHPRLEWTWGLRLLYTLRERGLPIKKMQIGRICRLRLNILFDRHISNRLINRRAKTLERHTETMYIRKMEEIWGPGLLDVGNPSARREAGGNMEKGVERSPDEHGVQEED